MLQFVRNNLIVLFAVERTEDNELLLSNEFLKNCRDMFSIPIMANETDMHEFTIKRLNILDPLNDNNNLGRSVSKGTCLVFFRSFFFW